MKALSSLFLTGILLAALLVPVGSLSDELPAPLEKTVYPDQEVIQYAGQTLRFTTSVALTVKLVPLEPGKIRLTFATRTPSRTGGAGQSAPAATVQVYWENWDNEIYSGPPPDPEPWDGVLLTESGFTEK